MKHAHVAIFSAPGATHVFPTLTIVTTLLRRGYRVTYVTSESFARLIEASGAEVLRCPRIEYPFNQTKNETRPVEEQYSPDVIDLASRTIPMVFSFYAQNRPDLILYDAAAYAGLVIADRLGIQAVRLSPQFAYNETSVERTVIPPALKKTVLDLNRRVDEFFREQGIQRTNVILDMAQPSVYLYVDDFQLEGHARDANNLYAGRCAAERFCHEIWTSERVHDRPSVLISASTTYREGLKYYDTCTRALMNLHVHAVLAIGKNDPTAFAPLPSNFEIIQSTPLTLVMPRVDIIICAAGMTTTMESMYHALPMLMLTHGHPELEAYAQNIENMGLGRHLREDEATADNIRQTVEQMCADRGMEHRVTQIQRKVRRSAGGEEVVNWIEERFIANA